MHTILMYDNYEGVILMRTTINISEDIIKEIEVLYKANSRSSAVEYALKDAIRFKKLQILMSLKNKINFDASSVEKLREAAY